MSYPSAPFTPELRRTIRDSRLEAIRLESAIVCPEHCLLGIIRYGTGLAVHSFQDFNIELNELKTLVESQLKPGGITPIESPRVNLETQKVWDMSVSLAHGFLHSWVGTEHLLLALIKVENTIPSRTLKDLGMDYERTRESVLKLIEAAS